MPGHPEGGRGDRQRAGCGVQGSVSGCCCRDRFTGHRQQRQVLYGLRKWSELKYFQRAEYRSSDFFDRAIRSVRLDLRRRSDPDMDVCALQRTVQSIVFRRRYANPYAKHHHRTGRTRNVQHAKPERDAELVVPFIEQPAPGIIAVAHRRKCRTRPGSALGSKGMTSTRVLPYTCDSRLEFDGKYHKT